MKLRKLLPVCTLAAVLLFSGCAKSDDPIPPSEPSAGETVATDAFVPPSGLSAEETVTTYFEYWSEGSIEKMKTLLSDGYANSSAGDATDIQLLSVDAAYEIDDVPAYLADMFSPKPNQKPAESSPFYFDDPAAAAFVSVSFTMTLNGNSETYPWSFTLEKESADADWRITNFGGG